MRVKERTIKIDDSDLNNFATYNILDKGNYLLSYYFNTDDSSLNIRKIYYLDNKEEKEKYYLKNVIKKNILEPMTSWLFVNSDSIFANSCENSQLYLFNTKDVILDSFPTDPGGKNYYCYSTYASMKYEYPNVVIPAEKKVYFDSISNKYFSLNGIIVNLTDKSVQQFGRFKEKKITNSLYYIYPYDYLDLKNNKIIFSSEEDPFIYEYNITEKTYKLKYCKSKYIDTLLPKPDSLLYNIPKQSKYNENNSYYEGLLFSNSGDNIYRLVKHKVEVEKNNEYYKKKKFSQKSIIILDTNFNILDEVIFDENNCGIFILPTKDGLFIENIINSENGIKCLDFFTIQK